MSADSELLIKIRTILESQGIDAAKAKLTELTQTTNTAGLSEATVNKERDKSSDKAEKTAKAIMAMNNAMSGGMGPFRAAISVANQLGGSFAILAFKASAIGAAITIGWNIGTKLREWVTGAKDVEAEMEKLKKVSDELRDRVSKLSDIRLSNLKIEAEGIAKGFSTAVDKAERLKRLSDLREDAQLAVKLADVNLAFQKGEINQETRDRLEVKFQGESERRKLSTEEKSLRTQEAVVNESENQTRGKYGELSRKTGMTSQDYDQAIETIKAAGIDDPEGIIADGPDSPKFKSLRDEARQRLNYATSQQKANRENILVNQDMQGPIDDQRVSVAQQKMDALSKLEELPGLKTVRDAAKKEFEAYKPEYTRVMDANAVKKEELSAAQESLADRYKSHDQTYEAKDQAITNQINDAKRQKELDEANKRTPERTSVARGAYDDLLGSLTLGTDIKRDNTGQAVGETNQAAYDANRMQSARDVVTKAGRAIYGGGDSDQIMAQLVSSLNALHVKITGKIRNEDELRKVIDRLNGIEGDMKSIKSQASCAPGLN